MRIILVLLTIPTTWSIEVNSPSSTVNQPNYQFPLNFASTTLQPFTEKTIYLPPETASYHPIITSSNLHYPYLPPTETKVPEKYPPSYANFLRQNFEENMKMILRRESEEAEDDEEKPVSTKGPINMNQNRSSDVSVRPIPKMYNVDALQERRDVKYPYYGANQQQNSVNQPQVVRRTVPQPQNIISTVTEHPVPDQYKMASQVSNQYAPFHQGYHGSTEEPIQILRLSNEMDIDGTFRYETLTGDQTHIMQQGHIANLGTDNEEQVIEGSYSYVGDNGVTYTVNYIADSNGFRATGEHLPVPPPMPEIIQRAVEYNMMEESKRPQNQQTENYPEFDPKLLSKLHQSQIQQQQPQQPFPQRSHFTGRQPEAFSRTPFSGGISNQNVNVQSASSPAPVVANPQNEQQFASSNIKPQITFMASQGAHNPVASNSTTTISRSYTFPIPETRIPVNNYFLNKYLESNQIRQPTNVEIENHALPWDLQRKFREMQIQEEQQKAEEEAKKSISRSSTDVEDEIMINFQDMTPEQYSNMYYSQIDQSFKQNKPQQPTPNANQKVKNELSYNNGQPQINKNDPAINSYSPQNNKYEAHKAPHIKPIPSYQHQTFNQKNYNKVQQASAHTQQPQTQNQQTQVHHQFNRPTNTIKTVFMENLPISESQRSYSNNMNTYNNIQDNNKKSSILITQQNYLPKSQTITASYDYDLAEPRGTEDYEAFDFDTREYEPKKLSLQDKQYGIETEYPSTSNVGNDQLEKQTEVVSSTTQRPSTPMTSSTTTEAPKTTPSNLLTIHNYYQQAQSGFDDRIMSTIEPEASTGALSTSSEPTFDEMLKNNFFLKNLYHKKNEKKPEYSKKESEMDHQKQQLQKKEHKKEMFHIEQQKLQEDNSKKMDISQIVNFVNMKNMFESSKIIPKAATQRQETYTKQNELHQETPISRADSYIPNMKENNPSFHLQNENYQNKLKGKVYKTLHRNNGNFLFEGNNLRTELTPPKFTVMPSENSKKGLPPLGRAGPNMQSYLPPLFT